MHFILYPISMKPKNIDFICFFMYLYHHFYFAP
nr:MAG TPA: hypothetical protein [Caudoviricetes sp.]